MIEINLAPDIKQELIKAQMIRSRVIAGCIVVGVVSVAVVSTLLVYVFTVQAVRGNLADNDIKTRSSQLSGVADLSKTLTIQNQLTKISSINNSKKDTSRVFNLLAAIIPPAPNDIKVSSLLINTDDSKITIEGQAANSYAAVEVFRKTIEGAKVKYTDSSNTEQQVIIASDVSTSNTSYGEDTSGAKVLRFTISFTYAKELFAPLLGNFSISISTSGNATDSYLGVPKSIFVDRAKDLTTGGQ